MIAIGFFIVFLGLSVVFSGLEMAYISRDRVSHMASMRGRVGFFYGTMPREVIATILLCNNLVNVGAMVAATNLFLDFTGRLQSATLATVLSTLSILILGEVIPKAVARSHPERFMRVFGPVVWWIWRIVRPIVAVLLRVVRVDVAVSPKAEARELVERMLREGRITEKESRIATRGLSLSEMKLGDACDRNFRVFTDRSPALAALSDQPSFTPILKDDGGFFMLDVRAVFSEKRDAFTRLHRMNESARVTSAITYMRKGEPVAVVNAGGNLVGLLTPQSLMASVIL